MKIIYLGVLVILLLVKVNSLETEEENYEEKEMQIQERFTRRKVKTFRLHPVGTCCPNENDDSEIDESCCKYYTYGFWAVSANNGTTQKIQNAGESSEITSRVKSGFNALQFVVSSKVLPYFHLAGYSNKAGSVTEDESFIGASLGRSFMIRLLFFSIIEYKETNGEEGFQPEGNSDGLDGDEVVAKYSVFNNAVMEKKDGSKISTNVKWSPISIVDKELSDGETVKALTFRLINTPKYLGEVRFSVIYSPVPIYEKCTNLTRKSVITPNALKFSMSITNITYQSEESTGLAIGVLMVTKKAIRKRLRKENNDDETIIEDDEGNEYESLDAATDEQEVIDVPSDEDEDDENAGFFSFKKKIWRKRLNQTGGVCDLISGSVENEWKVDTETASRLGETDKEFSVRALFFSIPERVTDFVWDPSVGAFTEEEVAGARTISFGALLLLGVLFFLL